MSQLALYLLGPPRIERDGKPVHIGRAKAVALLAYLAVEGGLQRRDSLLALLSPEFEPSRARNDLRRTLSVLNRKLGKGWLVADRETVGLDPDADVWLDVEQFRRRLADCDAHAHGPGADEVCAECVPSLEEAVELYHDDFLAGFTLAGSLPFDEWQFFQTERLKDELASALQRLIRWQGDEGNVEAAITYARRWLELDPTHEPAHRQLMGLYVQAGRRNAALRQYRTCVRLLEDELGVPPSAETSALYHHIRVERASVAPLPGAVRETPLPAFLSGQVAPADVARPVFVARESELAQLDDILEKALAGHGQVVFITGGPGRGKTSLMNESIRRAVEARADLLVATGACNAHAGVGDPYLPFREALAMLTGDVESRWAAGAISREGARRLWQAMPLTAQTVLDHGPYLIDALIAGPALLSRTMAAATGIPGWLAELQGWVQRERASHSDLEQRAIFEQYTNVLRSLSHKHPLLIVLDDLQWADKGSIGLLFHLGRRVQGERILILGAYRPEEVALQRDSEQHPLEKVVAEFQRQFRDAGLDLAEIDQTEGRRFVEALLDTEPNRLGPGFREALHHRAGGHPLFTVELLRTMQEQDDLVQDTDGAWIESPALEWGTLPARVEAVIRARIDRLDEELRDLLAVASVEGDQFTAQVVAEVQGCLDRELLHALSRELGAHHRIVREAGETQIEGRFLSRYQFGHVLFQSYLYRTLSPGERRLLHGEVGEALEGLYGAQAETIAVQLAHHYSEAGRPEKAAAYAHCAGDRAREAYANDEAIAHYQQVLALLDAPALQKSRDELRLAALRGLGQVYLGLGAIVEAEACFRAAIELGKKLRLAPRELVRLHWWLADALSWQSGYDDVMKIGEDGLKLLGVDLAAIHTYAPAKAIESVEVALMYTHIAYAHWMGSGRNLNKCWDIADRLAHIIPRLPYSPELRPTYVLLCEVCIRQKNAEQALKWMYLLEERANQDYDPRALGAAYLESAYTLNQSGDFKGALSLYKQGLEHFRRIGDVKHETLARREIGGVLLRTGAPPKALEYVLGGIEIAEASEFKAHFVASAYSLAGWIALCQGEWSQAERAFHQSIQNWQELGRSDGVAWNIHNLGRMYAAKGNAGRARRRFEEALAIVSEDKLATDSCLLASILSGLEDVYEDPEAFGAFCRCFKEELGGFYDLAFGRWHLGSIDESVQFRVPLQHYPFAESLASDWVWEDPMGDCSFDVRNGLAIYAANGRDLWHINLTAPRWLRPAPAEDCFAVQTVCVSVSDDMPAIGGLLLWRDKENYLRLDVGTRGADEISFQGCMENEDLVIGRGRLQGSAPESEQGSASRGPAWLRMERKGDTVRALCSADGEKWHTAGSVDFPFEGEAEIQVGLHAIGSIDRSIYHGAYPDGTAIRFESFTMCGLED